MRQLFGPSGDVLGKGRARTAGPHEARAGRGRCRCAAAIQREHCTKMRGSLQKLEQRSVPSGQVSPTLAQQLRAGSRACDTRPGLDRLPAAGGASERSSPAALQAFQTVNAACNRCEMSCEPCHGGLACRPRSNRLSTSPRADCRTTRFRACRLERILNAGGERPVPQPGPAPGTSLVRPEPGLCLRPTRDCQAAQAMNPLRNAASSRSRPMKTRRDSRFSPDFQSRCRSPSRIM